MKVPVCANRLIWSFLVSLYVGCSALSTDTAASAGIASIAITPANSSLMVGGIVQLTATLMDTQGRTLAGSDIAWRRSLQFLVTVFSAQSRTDHGVIGLGAEPSRLLRTISG